MKSITTFLFLLAITLPFNSFILLGQCEFENLNKTSISKLPPGFNFLKSYKIENGDGTKPKVEFSYVFTKGTQYLINMSVNGPESEGIAITLFDSHRNMVATSNVPAIMYPCNATGIYYIQYSLDKTSGCGSSALGFKR